MAQDNFINVTAGHMAADGTYNPQLSHSSASAGDMTISWDHTKFTTKRAFIDSLRKMEQFINSRGDLPN